MLNRPILRLLSSKHKDAKIFVNHLNPVMLVFIGQLSLSTLRGVPICQRFQSFSALLHHFVLAKLATSSINVNEIRLFQGGLGPLSFNPFNCFRVTLEIAFWIFYTFDTNLEIKIDFTKLLKENFRKYSDQHFSFYFSYAFSCRFHHCQAAISCCEGLTSIGSTLARCRRGILAS